MATDMVKTAHAHGITYFDTAEVYSAGDSEKQLGAALKSLGLSANKSVVVGSKITPNHCCDVEKYCKETL